MSFATAFAFIAFWTVVATGIVIIDQRFPLKIVEIIGATVIGAVAIIAIGVASLV